MVAISFSDSRLLEKLLSGEKNQTIRPYSERRYSIIKGRKILQIYWKQRTKECRKLFDAELTEIFLIYLFHPKTKKEWPHKIKNQEPVPMTKKEVEELVRRDGFKNIRELYAWFKQQYRKQKKKLEGKFMVIRFRRTK